MVRHAVRVNTELLVDVKAGLHLREAMNLGIILQINNCILGHLFDHIPVFREPPFVKLRNYEHYLSIQVLASDEEGD